MIYVIVAVAVLLLFFTFLYGIYRMSFHSPNGEQNNPHHISLGEQYAPFSETMLSLIDELLEKPYEDVYIKSFDGLTLHGRYYHYRDGAPLDIGVHGYRGNCVRDMCGGIHISYDFNHNILLIDQRAHGLSEKHTITMGINERYDCLSWIDYAKERFGNDVRIMLYGVSMGAATVLMTTEFDISDNVVCIIADCPYSSPADIIRKVIKDLHMISKLFYPFVKISAKLFGGFNLDSASAVEAVKNSKVPILILHGEDDRFVPCEMSKEIEDANPSMIERHTFPEAAHGISYLKDTPRYTRIVKEFIHKSFSGKENS